MSAVVDLPDVARLADAELEGMTPGAFVRALLDKAAAFGTAIMQREGYTIEELSPETRRERLIEWNRRHAWLEWWLGVAPPARQIVKLPDEDYPLKVRLSQQIIDEVKHQRVFAHRAKALGGYPRLEDFEPPAPVRAMYDSTFDFEDPLDVASSLQCTGEAVLMHHCVPERSIVSAIVDPDTLQTMAEDVMPDEIRHVKNGEDLLKKYCTTAQQRRRAAEVQDIKLRVLARHYVVDHELLGARRVAPVPTVGGQSLL